MNIPCLFMILFILQVSEEGHQLISFSSITKIPDEVKIHVDYW